MKRVCLVVVLCITIAPAVHADAREARSDNITMVSDLLIIAGYSTVIGASVGAALLAFTDKPSDNLHFISRGAAIGFLGGAVVGSFVVFSPLFIEEPWTQHSSPLQQLELVFDPSLVDAQLTVSPVFSRRGIAGLAARANLWKF